MARSETTVLAIDQIRRDGGTQSREALNTGTVDSYAEKMRDGAQLGAVIVFHDGKSYWLADGFHRIAACELAGVPQCAAEVRQGSQRDARLYSFGANGEHGLPRSPADARRAVVAMVTDAEWSKWSIAEIARRCKVSRDLVTRVQAEHHVDRQDTRTVTRGGVTYEQNTANIGKRAETTRPDPIAPHADDESLDDVFGGDIAHDDVTESTVTAPTVGDEAARVHRYGDLDEGDDATRLVDTCKRYEAAIRAELMAHPLSSYRNALYRSGAEGAVVRLAGALMDLVKAKPPVLGIVRGGNKS